MVFRGCAGFCMAEEFKEKLGELCLLLSSFNDCSLAFELRLRQHLRMNYRGSMEPTTTDTPATYHRLGLNGRGRVTGYDARMTKKTLVSSRTTQKYGGSSTSSPGVMTVPSRPLSQITGRTRRGYRHQHPGTEDGSPPDCSCEAYDFCRVCRPEEK